MVQAGSGLSLAAKPCLKRWISGKIGTQLFDCDGSTKPLINSTTNLCHAPAA
jgi:hypothetical protein